MNIKQKANEFRSIVNKMADLYEKKNSNYGDSFGQLYKELGPTAGLVPLWNKLHRATSLIKGDENHFESLEDTLKDLACYAIMNLIEMKAEQESRCKSKVEEDKEYLKKYCTPDVNRSGHWDALKGIWVPEVIDDSINIHYTTDPCEGCQTKKMLSQGITYVGDLPCQWCNKNQYKITCKGETNNEK